jgi:glutaredoxin
MKVTLFSKENCPYCDKVKAFIKEKGIVGLEFDESRNVSIVKKFADTQERMPQFPMLLVKDQSSGEEQGIFESEIIIQVLEQIFDVK